MYEFVDFENIMFEILIPFFFIYKNFLHLVASKNGTCLYLNQFCGMRNVFTRFMSKINIISDAFL